MQIDGFIHFNIMRDELGSEMQTLCDLWRQKKEGCWETKQPRVATWKRTAQKMSKEKENNGQLRADPWS